MKRSGYARHKTKKIVVHSPHILTHTPPLAQVSGHTSKRRWFERVKWQDAYMAVGALLVMTGAISSITFDKGYAGAVHNKLTSQTVARQSSRSDAAKSQSADGKKQSNPQRSDDSCRTRQVNIVAHEDDDLLFINPDISHALQAAKCVTTIYLTAGDDGRDLAYVETRELGVEQAYNTMLNSSQTWNQDRVTLDNGKSVYIVTGAEHPNVQLVFVRLPDGNLEGDGFPTTGYVSLSRLLNGDVTSMTTLDAAETYTKDEIVATLQELLKRYPPAVINTLAKYSSAKTSDHSDHGIVGDLAVDAASSYGQLRVVRYIGYPIRDFAQNMSSDDVVMKTKAFFTYAQYDQAACDSEQDCQAQGSAYPTYLSRKYTRPPSR